MHRQICTHGSICSTLKFLKLSLLKRNIEIYRAVIRCHVKTNVHRTEQLVRKPGNNMFSGVLLSMVKAGVNVKYYTNDCSRRNFSITKMNNAAVFGAGIGNANGLLRCGVVGPENNRTPVGRLPAAFGINHCSVKYDFVRAAALIFFTGEHRRTAFGDNGNRVIKQFSHFESLPLSW